MITVQVHNINYTGSTFKTKLPFHSFTSLPLHFNIFNVYCQFNVGGLNEGAIYSNGFQQTAKDCKCVKPSSCMTQLPLCFDVSAVYPISCSSGSCLSPSNCPCLTEPFCQVAICSGKSATDKNVCSGHGSCVAPGQCICFKGWRGLNCESEQI